MKKIFASTLVLLTATALLTACANDNSSQTASSSSSSSKTSASSSTASSSANHESESTQSSSRRSFMKDVSRVPVTVNRSEILNGNYTSLNGTWSNSHGYKIVINNGKITVPDNNSTTTYSLINPGSGNNIISLEFSPAPAPNGMSIMVASKNTSVQLDSGTDATDTSKDRIIIANNGGTSLFASKDDGSVPDTAYYRNN
jgi:hypothetical protein